jgi:hypothetical protein
VVENQAPKLVDCSVRTSRDYLRRSVYTQIRATARREHGPQASNCGAGQARRCSASDLSLLFCRMQDLWQLLVLATSAHTPRIAGRHAIGLLLRPKS